MTKYTYSRLLNKCLKDEESGCLIWQGSLNEYGYGKMVNESGKLRSVHRIAWELYHGPIAAKLSVSHTCGNLACIEPDHLILTTPQERYSVALKNGRIAAKKAARDEIRAILDYNEERNREIRGSRLSNVELAAKYQLTSSKIRDIKRSKNA